MYAQQPTPADQDPRKKRPDFQSTKGNKPSPSVDGGPVNDVAAGNSQSEAPIPYPLPAIGSKPITPPSPGPVPGPAITPNGGRRKPLNPEAIAARQAFMSKWRADNQRPLGGGAPIPQGPSSLPIPQGPMYSDDGSGGAMFRSDPKKQPPGYGGKFDAGFSAPAWDPSGQTNKGKPSVGASPIQIVQNDEPRLGATQRQANPGMEFRPRGGQRPIGGGNGGGIRAYPQLDDWASMYNGSGGDMGQFAGMLGGAGMPAQSDPRLAYFNMMSGQQ